ncbi:protein NRT1/ PTR FAMILY 1.2-like [Lycium barbarum]|uniref:protein NRT1/ PTR FAMILY 1.2-like n=1 Tax=Lycium barbarum TaxID=112863 RepID=UPI00293E53BC|nr:protein NRT1/ PTR FAMILY 1.2-like [Lycium barbarum]
MAITEEEENLINHLPKCYTKGGLKTMPFIIVFLLGSSLYIKVNASESLFTGFFEVLVAAVRKRNTNLHSVNHENYYHQSSDSEIQAWTNNFRYKLAQLKILKEIEINPDGFASNPWRLCSVEQVVSLKSLLRVVPMWSSNIMVQLSLNQFSFSTLQTKTMDRHIFSDFEIPAGSFSVFISTLIIWIDFYGRAFVPMMGRHTRQPGGLVLSSAAMTLSAITEGIRRHIANYASVNMLAMWFMPQYVLLGLADAFNAI